mmetsp:Transcript_31229/g.89524  ORF Transcript_31229/g.89524 Transcript_31229/m.89524 type:complete len:336 (+) Transcript_31229:89-1096(+)
MAPPPGTAAAAAVLLLLPLALVQPAAAVSKMLRARPTLPEDRQTTTTTNFNDHMLSSFQDDNGFICIDGDRRRLEAALATYKAQPLGTLFVRAHGKMHRNCPDRGFPVLLGTDPCGANGTRLWYHSEEARDKWEASKKRALEEYRQKWGGYANDLVDIMSGCSCHPESQIRHAVDKECHKLWAVPGAWLQHNPTDGHALTCHHGPFEYTVRTLAVLKSTPELVMHWDDQIAPKSCKALGFPEVLHKIDKCFPLLEVGTMTPIENDPGALEDEKIERKLLDINHFQPWAEERHMDYDTLYSGPGCHCLPDSQIGAVKKLEGSCDEFHSPVRDYWYG